MTYHMDFKFSQSVYDFPREEAQCFVKDVKQKVLHMHFQVNTNHTLVHILYYVTICAYCCMYLCVLIKSQFKTVIYYFIISVAKARVATFHIAQNIILYLL